MISYQHNIIINKLKVFQNSKCVCDIQPHNGVNIIYGQNSSGKSTLLDFIAYTLGAENIPFKPAALRCTLSYLELEINTKLITISREVNDKNRNHFRVFYGTIDDGVKAGLTHWLQFPYTTALEKMTFSRVFFELLNFPQPHIENSFLTMHQILRLIYADQLYTHPIFKFEKWDSIEKREAIRDFIFGIFTDELYNLQLERKSLNKNLDNKNLELKSIFNLLGKTEQSFNIKELEDSHVEKLNEKEQIQIQIDSVINSEELVDSNSETQIEQQAKLQRVLSNENQKLISLQETIKSYEYEILDSKSFISELDQRINDLMKAQHVKEIITDLKFEFCPCCHNPIKPPVEPDLNSCHLCKNLVPKDDSLGALLKMQSELIFQKSESSRLLAEREKEILELKKNYDITLKNFKKQEEQYNLLTKNWHSKKELILLSLYRQLGSIESDLNNINNILDISQGVSNLQTDRDSLQSYLNKVNEQIDLLTEKAKIKRYRISNKINSVLKDLISRDIREKEFKNVEDVKVVFEDNIIFVNNVAYFSQSSLIMLRHLFHLALLIVADSESSIRLPRIILLDGINDGGLEEDRAFLLQSIIIEESLKLKKPFQVIMATSLLSPAPEIDSYRLGPYYTESNPTLHF